MTLDRFRAGGYPPLPTSKRWEVARLSEPNRLWGSNGVAFGPDGRLYVAQFLAGQISAVDTESGDVEVIVPMGGPVEAPDDLAFGADGSMYIADLTPGRVWRRSPDGEYSLVADDVIAPNGITCVGDRLFVNEMRPDGRVLELFPDGRGPVVLTAGLAFGNAMQLGPDGFLYYPHMVTGEVWRISPEGGTPELVAEQVHQPVAARFDRAGMLVVLSLGAEGIVTTIDPRTGDRSVAATGIAGQDNAAFDEDNRMLVSSYASGGITAVDAGVSKRSVVQRGLSGPFGVAAGAHGEVYAGDHFRLATDAGGGDLASSGPLQQKLGGFVHGVAAAAGLVHVTGQRGDVRTYDPAQETTRVRAVGLREPAGITVEQDGSLIVAEGGAGRVLRIDETDAITVLAEGLARPSDVALDADGRCYVSDEQAGSVLRIADGATETVLSGLDRPQGLTVRGDELFVVEAGSRQLTAVSLRTGETAVEAEHLPVGLPPGVVRPEPTPSPFPGPPRPFTALTTAADGSLLLGANGEGTVLRLSLGP
jgi:sugar lactone lactonase YvrE